METITLIMHFYQGGCYMQQTIKFDAAIIGFGKGGKTLAATLGTAGKKTALIEKSSQMYGGTCINVGCIPTKFLICKARDARFYKDKQAYYQDAICSELVLTEKLRNKNFEKLQQTPNVTLITGTAQLLSSSRIEVRTADGIQQLEAEQIFINTGSVPVVPQIEGIEDNPYIVTSEELLRQTKLPKALVIIGGGYIGVEFASMYANFGSQVTVIQNESHFLPREDEEIADAVRRSLADRKIELLTDAHVKSVAKKEDGAVITVVSGDVIREISADTVLIATGRKPNTQALGLERAGVKLAKHGGIVTDAHLRSTASNIYAMGDVIGGLQFTYISLDDFRIVRSSILGDGSYTINDRGVIPYSVFLDPPFSRVGLSEREAVEQGYTVQVARLLASSIPKALVVGQPTGILKAVIDKKTGLILGAHLFCEESHEIINTVKLVMDAKLPYTALRDMVFTHPTMSEAFNDLFHIGFH